MGKKRASKMDIDDVAPTQQGEQTAGPVKDGAEDDTPGLTGKDKKKAEWLARQQLKAKVGAIKKERGKLSKKNYVEKADRRALDRHLRVLTKEDKAKVRAKNEERHVELNSLPGASLH